MHNKIPGYMYISLLMVEMNFNHCGQIRYLKKILIVDMHVT